MHPTTTDPVAWSVWAVRMYGIVQFERDQDKLEEACLADLKKKGVIR